jgi:tetratricopeptide (TPR) repeat protein
MNATTVDAAKARYALAIEALNRGDWAQAQQVSMDLVRTVPEHAGVLFVAGVAARELLQIPLALQCLQRATTLNPNRADYLAQYARALSQASLPSQAVAAADRAAALEPADALTCDTLGVVYSQGNDYPKAAAMFSRVVELAPGIASFRFNHATSLVAAGDLDAAEREFEAAIVLDPASWKAYLSRANLRKQTAGSNHVDALRAALASAPEGDGDARLFLHLALAKELEDLGEFPESFDHLRRGKAAGAARRDYAPARDRALFEAIMESFPGAQPAAAGHASDEPIFVFGMPRSGTTLVERILSSHPQVQSCGELHNFGVALKRASHSQTRPMLDVDTVRMAAGADWATLGRAYLESTRPLTGKSPRFTDKLPHNFLYAGYIANALPGARLVCVRRNPMDTCLGNFRQLFSLAAPNYDYSFDLLDTGRYYLLFDQLMRFWQQALPGRIVEVRYEDVIEAQEAQTRMLLEACGLPWDDACLAFERNAAPVATASAVQVREPIHRDRLQRWRHFEPQLQPLRELLEAGGVAVEG